MMGTVRLVPLKFWVPVTAEKLKKRENVEKCFLVKVFVTGNWTVKCTDVIGYATKGNLTLI